MFIASVVMRPSYPRLSRSTSVSARRLKVAGVAVRSSACAHRWVDITKPGSASSATRNGTSSVAANCAQVPGTAANATCVSVSVLPWPGKCFSVARTPFACAPRT